jgi:GNAT superfamily N-acetyltransferase
MLKTTCAMQTLHLLESGFRRRGLSCGYFDGKYNLTVFHPAGSFKVGMMPGNRRVLISFASFVQPSERGKGLGQRLLRLRQDVAREAGINLMLATVRDDNRVERHLLRKAKWFVLAPRPETGTSLWAKRLRR